MRILRIVQASLVLMALGGASAAWASPPVSEFQDLKAELSSKQRMVDTPAKLSAFPEGYPQEAPRTVGNQVEVTPGNPHDAAEPDPI